MVYSLTPANGSLTASGGTAGAAAAAAIGEACPAARAGRRRRRRGGATNIKRRVRLRRDPPCVLAYGVTSTGGTFQMSLAYSRMVRSELNLPVLAMLRIDLRFQDSWSV